MPLRELTFKNVRRQRDCVEPVLAMMAARQVDASPLVTHHFPLERIEEGTYGYCEETGEPISLKRLDARPIATLSVEAQERHERREKVHRDD